MFSAIITDFEIFEGQEFSKVIIDKKESTKIQWSPFCYFSDIQIPTYFSDLSPILVRFGDFKSQKQIIFQAKASKGYISKICMYSERNTIKLKNNNDD